MSEVVYGYYLSGAQDVPGKFLLESRTLGDLNFYLITNNSNTGQAFTPDLSSSIVINIGFILSNLPVILYVFYTT